METTENIEVKKRGRGRPPVNGVGAMSAAARKRRERSGLLASACDADPSEWNEAVCLWVLSSAKVKVGALDKAAWKRLGEIRGYS